MCVGVGRGGGRGASGKVGKAELQMIPWLPEALRAVVLSSAFRMAAPACPAVTFFGTFALLILVVSETGCGSVTLSICWFSVIL